MCGKTEVKQVSWVGKKYRSFIMVAKCVYITQFNFLK